MTVQATPATGWESVVDAGLARDRARHPVDARVYAKVAKAMARLRDALATLEDAPW